MPARPRAYGSRGTLSRASASWKVCCHQSIASSAAVLPARRAVIGDVTYHITLETFQEILIRLGWCLTVFYDMAYRGLCGYFLWPGFQRLLSEVLLMLLIARIWLQRRFGREVGLENKRGYPASLNFAPWETEMQGWSCAELELCMSNLRGSACEPQPVGGAQERPRCAQHLAVLGMTASIRRNARK